MKKNTRNRKERQYQIKYSYTEDVDSDYEPENDNYMLLSTEEKERFNYFKEAKCRFDHKIVHNMIEQRVQEDIQVPASTGFIASHALRLFTAELVETARQFSGEEGPLTPDVIYIAFNHLMEKGKIPGKGPGHHICSV